MRAQRAAMTYYVGYEGEQHGTYIDYDTIFEALAAYYQAINDGPTSSVASSDTTGDEEELIEVEFGETIDDEMEPLETHSFSVASSDTTED